MKEVAEKICGKCVHFKYEDHDGWGQCVFCVSGMCHCTDLCSSIPDDMYESEERKRHYLAVLRQLNRYRRDDNVPCIYRMPDSAEVGKAIDFVVEYAKLY